MKDEDFKKLEKENKELSKKYSKKKLSGYKIIIGLILFFVLFNNAIRYFLDLTPIILIVSWFTSLLAFMIVFSLNNFNPPKSVKYFKNVLIFLTIYIISSYFLGFLDYNRFTGEYYFNSGIGSQGLAIIIIIFMWAWLRQK